MPQILLLDNRDSFVWNLAQGLQVLAGEAAVRVVRSDACTVDQCLTADALVLSPGPGRPEDAGICIPAVQACHGNRPILGICLGHQAIAAAFGAQVLRTAPCHGHPWSIRHSRQGLFAADGLPPQELTACRYHSLAVDPATLADDWAIDASTPEGVPMAIRHRTHPTFGLQFHPESFRSPDGMTLLGEFLRMAGLLMQNPEAPASIR